MASLMAYPTSTPSPSSRWQESDWILEEKDFVNSLPDEVLLKVWLHLDNLIELFVFGQVCRRWRNLTSDDRIWARIFALAFGKKALKKAEAASGTRGIFPGWRPEFFKRLQRTVLRCQITFAIRYNTVPGQMVAIIGNAEALGAWDLKRARRMEYAQTPSEDEPNWKLTISIPIGLTRRSVRLEYKYVLVDDNTNPLRWEGTSRRKEIFRGESVYYMRNYWNRVGFEFASGYRHQQWERAAANWRVDLRKLLGH
jgi:hypothetical protein